MKTVALFIFLILFTLACKTERYPLLDLTLLTDATDALKQPVSYEDVRQFLNYHNSELLWYEASLRKRKLTHIRHGELAQCNLPAGAPNTTTEQQRKMVVKRFLQQVESMIGHQPIEADKSQSHLYYGIAEELNRLAQRPAMHRIALISSDLLENTHDFSVYREADQKLLHSDPDSVVHILSKELPLQDLSGISVYIIYQASLDDHESFTRMAQLYERMLTEKGARVTIAGNLIPQPIDLP